MSLVSKLDSLLVLVIETPHTLHTHIISLSYIHIVFQHILLWLAAIRMQLHTGIFCLSALCPLALALS
jgi:hypothetical protein